MIQRILLFALGLFIAAAASAQNVGVGTNSPASKLDVTGSFGTAVTTATASTTLDGTYSTILASAGITLTLPTAVSAPRRIYTIVFNASSGSAVTIARSGTDNISNAGATSTSYSLASGSVTLQSDGVSKWYATVTPLTSGSTLPISGGTGITIGTGNVINSLWTASSTNIYNNNSGNVMIGSSTNSPVQSLTITNPSDIITGGAQSESSTHALGLETGQTTSDYILYMGADKTNALGYLQAVHYGVAIANMAINPRGGYVGIGTISPASQLANSSTNPIAYDGNGVNGSGLTWVATSGGYVADFFNSGTCSSCDGLAVKLNSGSTGKLLDLSVGAATSYSTSSTSVMVALASGNVGIGTATPQTTLEVTAAATDILKITSTIAGAGNKSYIDFLTFPSPGVNNVNGRIGVIDMGSNNGSLIFETGNQGTPSTVSTERMRILNTGNVGIGTTTPSSLLSVGSTSQFQVNSSGAIAAATGITSSGTITFSGLSTLPGFVYANSSGVLSIGGTSVTLPIQGGTGITIGTGNTINSYWTLNSSNNIYNNYTRLSKNV